MEVYAASPGLKAGRGLKHLARAGLGRRLEASPGLKAGRGLKQPETLGTRYNWVSIARPQGRARIETSAVTNSGVPLIQASPGLKAGRGLKHASA